MRREIETLIQSPNEMQQSQAKSVFIFQSGLDNELLYDLYESDYESTLQAFQIFLDELHANISELEQAYSQHNIPSFQKIVHRCKPVFSYVGLTGLNNTFQLIEDQCDTMKHLDQMTPNFKELVKQIKASFPIIEKERGRLQEFVSKS